MAAIDKKQIEDNKSKFIEIYKKYIKREGADKLLIWIEKSDFFSAPASTKFHSAFEGGLCDHSLKVFDRLVKLATFEKGKDFEKHFSMETLAIVALLHDVCKIDFYKVDSRNVKENGEWKSVPFYSIDDKLPYGHGEKSVYILSGFIRLSREEAMAINWHMGGFDDRVMGGSFAQANAFMAYPLCVLVHATDLMCTYLDE